MIHGIDVSGWNTDSFPTAGNDFVFIKATEGTSYINPRQGKQTAYGRTAGLALGFYHFLHAGSIPQQAAYFVEKCASLPGDMLVCDWETPGAGAKPASNAEKDAFIREVKRLRPDHKVGLYCNLDYWKNHDVTSYAGDFLWIADPGHKKGEPSIEATWKFHQYGVLQKVDQNVADFPTRAALRIWCGYPTVPQVPTHPPVQPTAYDKTQDTRLDQLASKVSKLEAD